MTDGLADESVIVTCDVQNTGSRSGDEIVQLYIHDLVASASQPKKALRGFERVTLAAGEVKKVKFRLEPDKLAIYNNRMERVVEPGEFEIMIGSSSEDIHLRGKLLVKE